MIVNEKCEVELQIGKYKDKVMFDVMQMDVCHIFLGRPWKYDRGDIHDGNKNTYKFHKDGIDHTLIPIKDEGTSVAPEPKALMLSGKRYL